MADAFGRQDQVLMGGLSSDNMFMTWPELAAVGGGLGMLIQQVGLNYRQPVRRIFEIGPGVVPVPLFGFVNGALCDVPNPDPVCALRSQPTYYIIGRPEGRLQFGRFVGPNVIGTAFYSTYGNPCSSNVLSLSGRAGCSTGSSQPAPRMTWTMNGTLLDTIDMNVNGQEMVIQEGLGAMFAGLSITVQQNQQLVNQQLIGVPPGG